MPIPVTITPAPMAVTEIPVAGAHQASGPPQDASFRASDFRRVEERAPVSAAWREQDVLRQACRVIEVARCVLLVRGEAGRSG